MFIEGMMRAIHVTLCPFLVLGLWIFPHLGIRGAALSNVISQSLGAVAVLWGLFAGRSRLHVHLADLHFAPRVMWRLLRVGIPALVMNLQGALGGSILMRFIVPFGTLGVAALSLARAGSICSCPSPESAWGAGAGVLVGHNLGASRPERAERSAWLAVGFVQAFMMACCAVILLWADQVVGIFGAGARAGGAGQCFPEDHRRRLPGSVSFFGAPELHRGRRRHPAEHGHQSSRYLGRPTAPGLSAAPVYRSGHLRGALGNGGRHHSRLAGLRRLLQERTVEAQACLIPGLVTKHVRKDTEEDHSEADDQQRPHDNQLNRSEAAPVVW